MPDLEDMPAIAIVAPTSRASETPNVPPARPALGRAQVIANLMSYRHAAPVVMEAVHGDVQQGSSPLHERPEFARDDAGRFDDAD